VALIVKTQDPSEGCTRQRLLRQLGSWLGRGPAGDGRAQLLAGIPAGLVAAVVAGPPRWSCARTPGIKVLLLPRLQSPFKGGPMSYARQMLDTYPGAFGVDASVLATAIDALSDCAQACTTDVDADLSEQNLAAAAGLRGHLQELRRRVRAACPALRALPGLRAGLPALRAGLPRVPGRPEITHRAFCRTLAHPPPSPIPLSPRRSACGGDTFQADDLRASGTPTPSASAAQISA
jgi:hypothetical protein